MTTQLSSPLVVGITGGIGSGKSYLCRRLEAAGFPVFYCDDEARRLMRTDRALQACLSALVGCELFPDGILCKPLLREYLHQSPSHAGRVDAIVHPRVARAFTEWCAAREDSAACLVMECALLFESGFDRLVHLAIAVTAPLPLRIQRVMQRDGVDSATVGRWIALQMSDDERARRAALVYDNAPGVSHPLQGDIGRLPESFRRAIIDDVPARLHS